jgi:hypothetical protein
MLNAAIAPCIDRRAGGCQNVGLDALAAEKSADRMRDAAAVRAI